MAKQPEEDSLEDILSTAAARAGQRADQNKPVDDDSAQAEYERLQTDLAEAKDRTLRAQAELENYRKRARREMDDERRYAAVSLLGDLLPVLDNIQRAIDASQKNPDPAVLLEGIKLVKQQLDTVLTRQNCVKIEALGQPFDPAFHEAISQQPSADHPPHTVLYVVQDGYMLGDRVVRPVKVIVSTSPQ